MLVAAVAMLISLAGPAVDQQSSASPALAALGDLVCTVYDAPSNSASSSRDEFRDQAGRSLAVLFDELAKLPPATGMWPCPISHRKLISRTTTATTPNQARTPHLCSAVDRHVSSVDWLESPFEKLDGQDGSILA